MLKVPAVTISKYLLLVNFMKDKKKKGHGQEQLLGRYLLQYFKIVDLKFYLSSLA